MHWHELWASGGSIHKTLITCGGGVHWMCVCVNNIASHLVTVASISLWLNATRWCETCWLETFIVTKQEAQLYYVCGFLLYLNLIALSHRTFTCYDTHKTLPVLIAALIPIDFYLKVNTAPDRQQTNAPGVNEHLLSYFSTTYYIYCYI